MNIIKQGKTNWNYILIVIVLGILVAGTIFIYQKDMIQEMTSLLRFSEIKKPEKGPRSKEKEWEVSEEGFGPLVFTNLTTGETKEFFVEELLTGEMREELTEFSRIMLGLEIDEEPPYLLLGRVMTWPLKWSTDFQELWGAVYNLSSGDPPIAISGSLFKINIKNWELEKFMIPRGPINDLLPDALDLEREEILYETVSDEGGIALYRYDLRFGKEEVIISYPREILDKYFYGKFWLYVTGGTLPDPLDLRHLKPKWIGNNTISYLDIETREEIIKKIE